MSGGKLKIGGSASTGDLNMENSNLEGEIAELRTRLAAVQEIGSALGTTLNLDRLLELIMQKVTALMKADRSTLYLIDHEKNELWAKIAQGLRDDDEIQEFRLPIGEGIAGWVAKTGRSLNMKDAYKDRRFNRDFDEATGYRTRSMLCQPMCNYRGKTIGVVQVLNKENGYFTLQDEKLLSALSSQAAISLENSKLYRDVQRKNIELEDAKGRIQQKMEEREVLLGIEQVVSTGLDLDEILEKILDRAMQSIPSAAGSILVKDRKTNQLVFRSSRGSTSSEVKKLNLAPGQGIVGWVAKTGESVLTNHVAKDDRHAREVAQSLSIDVRTLICVPIYTKEEVLGAVQLLNKKGSGGRYVETDLELLTLIAGQLARAIQVQRARDEINDQSRLAAIGQSISGLLHDMKTPMTIISGYVQLMEGEEEPDERKDASEIIRSQLKHLDTMMREVLAFAKGELKLFLQKVFLAEFIEKAAENLRKDFEHRKIELNVDLQYRGAIRMDVDKMQRALFNLARNAAEAMPDGGTFTIRSEQKDDQLVLEFEDTGGGIPPEIEDRLFDTFVTSGKKEGTGLGLAIVKKVIEQHQGTIGFHSRPGEGTTFQLTLPIKGPDTEKQGEE